MKRRYTATGSFDYAFTDEDENYCVNVVISYTISPVIPATYTSPAEGGEVEWDIESFGRAVFFGEPIALSDAQREAISKEMYKRCDEEIVWLAQERESAAAE